MLSLSSNTQTQTTFRLIYIDISPHLWREEGHRPARWHGPRRWGKWGNILRPKPPAPSL